MSFFESIKKRQSPFVIAEIGVNYYDIAKALKIDLMSAAKLMVKEAKKSKCDAVKFQSYKAQTLASKNSPAYWDTKKEVTKSQYELFSKFDAFGAKEYFELYEYCKKINIDFSSTPFDYDAADYLEPWVNFFKVSSSDLNNLPFIEHIAQKKKPIFLSTGASTLEEIGLAIETVMNNGISDICIMHCVLEYPTPHENAHLNIIKSFKNCFPDFLIGYSDHTIPDENMFIPTFAYINGAQVIEKHFTLDKSLAGNDHYHAADPTDFLNLHNNINLLTAAGGSYIKKIFSSEKAARKYARRSLVASKDILPGESVNKDHIIAKRPGIGIAPSDLKKLIGCKAIMEIKSDTVLKWDMFENNNS